jgi:calcineurin-like phosphoesterase family protein
MFFFTSDEHYGHKNVIKFCNRPFSSVEEMDERLIQNFNLVVKPTDTTIHGGDFTFYKGGKAEELVKRLNGYHIFLNGSHDYWLKGKKGIHEIWEKNIFHNKTNQKHHITVCHYCMRTWPRSHYNSYHLYGHSHAGLPSIGKSHDIGVDNNDFYPLSFDEIVVIMSKKPDNPNLIRR